MSKPSEVYEYLLNNYSDNYHILFTGSRAMGVSNKDSDWDFYICPKAKHNPFIEIRSSEKEDFKKILKDCDGLVLKDYSEKAILSKIDNYKTPDRFKRYVMEILFQEDNEIKKINIIFESKNNYKKWKQATEYCNKYKDISINKEKRIKIFRETFGIEQGISVYKDADYTN